MFDLRPWHEDIARYPQDTVRCGDSVQRVLCALLSSTAGGSEWSNAIRSIGHGLDSRYSSTDHYIWEQFSSMNDPRCIVF